MLLWTWLGPVAAGGIHAQSAGQVVVQGTDEQRRFLDVRRRQIELSAARTNLKRTQDLFAQGLVSKSDLDRAEGALQTAQLGYQESVLALLNVQPRLSVREAMKSQTPDGRQFVRLTVVNLTPTFDDSQFALLNNFEGADPIPEALRTRDIRDIYLSLKDAGGPPAPGATDVAPRGTTIALPYEVHVEHLGYGQSRTTEFQLLRDVNRVVVASTYKGQTQEIDVELQQAAISTVVAVISAQISQEADLGGQATFDLRLERSSVDVRQFELKVVNLPRQVSYSFVDAGARDASNQARLSQLSFASGVSRQSLGLRLFLPERADDQVRIDQPLEFWALVMTSDEARRFNIDRVYSPQEIESSRAGAVRLAIVPRGAGRIEVSAPSLYSEINPGDRVEVELVARNTGTRRLDNIKVSADAPLNWRVGFTPDIVPALDINHVGAIRMRVEPPPDVAVGDYEVRVKCESFAFNRRVPSEDKIYRISIKARTNVLAIAGLLALLLGLVGAIIVAGMKLTRR